MEEMDVMPKNFSEEYFTELNRAARIANFSGEELEEYRKAMRTERDRINQLAFAHDKGVEEGLSLGKAETSKAIASALKLQGTLSIEQITQATGLSKEVIVTL